MRTLVALLAVLLLTLSGCSDGGGKDKDDPTGTVGNDDVLDVTDDTGGIRGVVVDQSIKPVSGAIVSLNTGQNMTTKDDGQFTFSGLDPGSYFIGVGKAGYRAAQLSVNVEAGVAEPAVVKVLLEALATTTPYVEYQKLEGFYECAYAFFFITDGCDWVYRTAWDEANGTVGVPPGTAPRTIQKFQNTQYLFVSADTFTIIQEAFWPADTAPEFMVMLDTVPIRNECDCSDTYQTTKGPPGLLSRLERFAPDGSPNTDFHDHLGFSGLVGEFPTDVTVAARGFLPPPDGPSPSNPTANHMNYALNMQFQVFTTLFHNGVPDPAWTIETKDQYELK